MFHYIKTRAEETSMLLRYALIFEYETNKKKHRCYINKLWYLNIKGAINIDVYENSKHRCFSISFEYKTSMFLQLKLIHQYIFIFNISKNMNI